MGRTELIACFQDTLSQCCGDALGPLTREAAENSRVYPENFRSTRLYKVSEPMIRVIEGTTFDLARETHVFGKVAVLNFANPHFPGGGVQQGAMAQEECLCRSSNLYPCLESPQVFEDYYMANRSLPGQDFSDRVVLSPGVTVFKDDTPVPRMLHREDWFRVDVLTCAAPYLGKRRHVNRAVLEQLLCRRIRNILEVAIETEAEVLILGAFGCGAFRNPPEITAAAFRKVLSEHRYHTAFSKVIFAIKSSVGGDPYTVCPNLAAFQTAFYGESQELEKLRYVGGSQEDPGAFDVKLPGGRIRYRGSESREFHQWRMQNPYFGKQFSVLGDSISTLEGFHPRGNKLFYDAEAREKTGIWEMEDTWWGKVIDFFGGELLVNDSWSGCRVSRPETAQSRFPSGCCDERTGNLHVGEVQPDVILVYMGINDWGVGVPLAGQDMTLEKADTTFALAYGLMLNKLRKHYPLAEICCCTLARTYMSANPEFRFPEAFGGISLGEYNRQITNAALANHCRVLDLDEMDIPYDTLDGTHPNKAGMDTLAMCVVRQLADDRGAAMLDCELTHERTSGFCRRCGKFLREKRAAPLRLQLRSDGRILTGSGWVLSLGRSRDCELVVDNGYVARYQATFTFREGCWHVRDNETRNGTYLNGNRLDPNREYALNPGDVVSFAGKEDAVVL